ncbi:MAG: PaaI family thioesterase [Opitutaceae bacterium]|nr:PaaI family thioesterase [Opitutaceae bacterium]
MTITTMVETATAPTEGRRRDAQQRAHPHCFVCGDPQAGGLGLAFRVLPDGGVAADWHCPSKSQGFDGILHGGLIATLVDSAMVHALFARGVVARTAELRVRYRHPVRAGHPVSVVARLCWQTGPLSCLKAEVCQEGAVRANAQGKFMAGPV